MAVEKAWREFRELRPDGSAIRPLGRRVVIRLMPMEQKTQTGLLWLAPSATGFYSGPMHLRKLKGLVMAVGPEVKHVKVGEVVVFLRRDFGWWVKNGSTPVAGHVDETQLLGYANPADIYLE
jgi:co-chaperonin GroES (HSP10)